MGFFSVSEADLWCKHAFAFCDAWKWPFLAWEVLCFESRLSKIGHFNFFHEGRHCAQIDEFPSKQKKQVAIWACCRHQPLKILRHEWDRILLSANAQIAAAFVVWLIIFSNICWGGYTFCNNKIIFVDFYILPIRAYTKMVGCPKNDSVFKKFKRSLDFFMYHNLPFVVARFVTW